MTHTTVVYEGTPGHRLRTSHLEVVGIADDGLEQSLHSALAAGTSHIELCGGLGPTTATAVLWGAAGSVPVGFVDP